MTNKVLELQTKIGISGEDDYREACKTISKNISVVNSEMRLLTAEFAGNEKSTKALTAKQDVLKKKMSEQANQVKATEEMLKRLKETGQEGSETWKTYEAKLNNSKAAMKETENQIKSIDKELKENGLTWGKVGHTVGEAAKGFGIALAALGTAAIGAATGLAKLTVDTSNWADDILTQSEYTRLSTDELQKYEYACRFIDADINTLTKSMAKNIKSMDAAREGTGATADAYAKIGVSVKNADGSLRDSNDVFWESIDALKNVRNETERDALAMQLFGKSAQEMNAIINAGSKEFKSLGDEAEKFGAVMSKDQIERLGKFNDKINVLQAAGDGLKRSMSLVALPFLDMLAAEGIPILGNFSKAVNDADGDLSKMAGAGGEALSQMINLVIDKLPEFAEMGITMIEALIQGIVDNAGQMSTGTVKIVTTLVQGISRMLPLLLKGAADIVVTLARGIAESLPTLIPTIVGIIPVIIQTIIDSLPMLLDGALAIITGLAEGLLASLPVLIEALPAIIQGIVDFIVTGIPMIIEAGVQLLTALVAELPTIIEAIVTVLPQIIEGITTALRENIPLIITAGIQLITSLVTALPEIIQTIVAALPEIIDAIIKAITENLPLIIEAGITLFVALVKALPEILFTLGKAAVEIVKSLVTVFWENRHEIIDAGKNMIEGLWDGIVAMKDWLFDKVSGFFGDVVGWAKKTLGIKSPSTVFAGIGEFMAEGLGIGFSEEIANVSRMIQRETAGLIPSIGGLSIETRGRIQGIDERHAKGNSGNSIQIGSLHIVVQGSGKNPEADGRKAARGLVNELASLGVALG